MLVPMSWLREFTPYEGTTQTLGDKLTMLGLELEDIVNPFSKLADIKVGFVAQCIPHPNSDHMSCCKVDIGSGQMLDIVCGAPNVAEGQKVAVAPPGATLPDGTRIKPAKLRGQPSEGMICSERELGLSEDHSGIMILPESLDTGHSLIASLNLDTDVLDLSITPNRADCLSILGIARETAAAFKLPLHLPELPLILDKSAEEIVVPIEIADKNLCWLYSGRVITGAAVKPSPMKMRYRLYAVGIRAISNIVDVTNYILMECGQPLHSFDLDKLAGKKIIVRNARQGETLTTLDGRDRALDPSDLCICDQDKPVGLAGVMGGENTEITPVSKNIFIESAVFNPQSIRRTARRHNLHSEAAYRFERGIDQRRTVWALDRASALMASLSGGFIRKGFSCAEPKPFRPVHIEFKPVDADKLLGVKITSERQGEILEGLGCAVEKNTQSWMVIQPSWRPDLTRTADIIEEVGRVYGLDTIKPVLPPILRQMSDDLSSHGQWHFWQLIKSWGAGLGLNEVINYSFVGQKDLDFLNLPKAGRLGIFNPLSEDQNVLRTELAPGLLRDLANNLAYGAQSVKLFELASIFETATESETGAAEFGRLGILLSGARHEPAWPPNQADFDYADIKGLLENLGRFLHLPALQFKEVREHAFLRPAIQVTSGREMLGYAGRIQPLLAEEYHSQKPVWYAELALQPLYLLNKKADVTFHVLPVYPGIKRDITITAPYNLKVDQILERLSSTQIPILEGGVLVDCYEHPDGQSRNLTFRLYFRHPERTLKDAEVDKEREKIAAYLQKELDVRL